MGIGKSLTRVDAYEKATGRTKYTDDLCDKSAYIARVVHSTVANGKVLSVDTSEAEKVPGVVKIITCFDVPKNYFPTSGHPWSTDPHHQDVCDRLVLTDRVRFYGDDVACVIAEDEIAAAQAERLVKVEYEEYPVMLDVMDAMAEGATQLHEKYPNNILAHTQVRKGDFEEAIKEEGLIKVEGWYETPTVQHCHIENFICYSYMEQGRVVVVSSTQIPHIVRRICGQALGIPWGNVRIIKPYIGGGFGNKQDALYEPLCAFLTTQVGGHLVKLDCAREETFVANRVRHALRIHITSYLRKDGTIVARKSEHYSNQGGYASHGHAICAKGMNCYHLMYPCPNVEADAYTVFTNRPVAGAMRGYGIPQAMFAFESHEEDIVRALGLDSVEHRRQVLMPKGLVDPFSKNECYYDTYKECLDKGAEMIDYYKKRDEYAKQTGRIRRGIGVAAFWYNTAVWPISLETCSCRMVMNQDGSIQVQLGETEIGQGADTAYTQMAAEVVGLPDDMVHIVSCQDTDITPFGTGAYASRQTYTAGFGIRQTGLLLKDRILDYAQKLTRMPKYNLDIVDGNIIRSTDGRVMMTVGELATEALYNMENSQHLAAQSTATIRSNAFSMGCAFAEVEVDIDACRVQVLDLVNVHDCGKVINPQLAEAQVHGGQSMAIGFALSEMELFDQKTGRVLNNNLLDYKLSTSMDHPHLRCAFVENPEPTSAFGTKSLGEPPACPVAPAIRNAVLNATGVAVNELPLRPQTLFEHFTAAGLYEQKEV